jgi:hypothetical protein
MTKCGWEGEDTTCPEFDDDTTLECRREATQRAIIAMPDPDEDWPKQEIFSCDMHATPIKADAMTKVIRNWEPWVK